MITHNEATLVALTKAAIEAVNMLGVFPHGDTYFATEEGRGV